MSLKFPKQSFVQMEPVVDDTAKYWTVEHALRILAGYTEGGKSNSWGVSAVDTSLLPSAQLQVKIVVSVFPKYSGVFYDAISKLNDGSLKWP